MNFNTYFPPTFFLETDRVLMRPLQEIDFEPFLALTQSTILWKYFTKELHDEIQLLQWMEEALNERASSKRVPFTIIQKDDGSVCGSTSLGNISFYDKRIEIGWSWLGEKYLGSGINSHCKYALLKYAFDVMQFERVEIRTDNLNLRAKKAIEKIGGIEEGILRSHTQMPHNRRRDTVYYSILIKEWENARSKIFSNFI